MHALLPATLLASLLLSFATGQSTVALSYHRQSSSPLRYSSLSTDVSSVLSSDAGSAAGSVLYYVLPPSSSSSSSSSSHLDGVSSYTSSMPLSSSIFQSSGSTLVHTSVNVGVSSVTALASSLSVPVVSFLPSVSDKSSDDSAAIESAVVQVGEDVTPAMLDKSLADLLKSSSPPDAIYLLSSSSGGVADGRRLSSSSSSYFSSSSSSSVSSSLVPPSSYVKYSNYYVKMTPNILAGVLFMFLFVFVVLTAFLCMNDIEGQTYFVKRMPVVGKEY